MTEELEVVAEELPLIPDGFGDEVAVCGRLQKLAPQYHTKEDTITRTRAEQDAIRDQLAYEFAVLKAIRIGKGRDSTWGPSVVDLGFAVRTVDRWVAQKLASGELPAWVMERLVPKQDSDSDPDPADLQDEDIQSAAAATGSAVEAAVSDDDELSDATCECNLRLVLSVEEKAKFLEALDKLIGFGGSTNRVEAIYQGVLYAAEKAQSAPIPDPLSGSPEVAEVIQ